MNESKTAGQESQAPIYPDPFKKYHYSLMHSQNIEFQTDLNRLLNYAAYHCHKHGNIGSLVNALEFIGFEYKIVDKYDQSVVRIASGFILPGVGSFDSGMNALKARGLDNLIKECSKKGIKVLGYVLACKCSARVAKKAIDLRKDWG